eukprot:1807-Alexandrium_andersonii.AAC.1
MLGVRGSDRPAAQSMALGQPGVAEGATATRARLLATTHPRMGVLAELARVDHPGREPGAGAL